MKGEALEKLGEGFIADIQLLSLQCRRDSVRVVCSL